MPSFDTCAFVGQTHTLRAGNPKPNQLTSEGGLATITLTRRFLNDHDYSFGIILRVYKSKAYMM